MAMATVILAAMSLGTSMASAGPTGAIGKCSAQVDIYCQQKDYEYCVLWLGGSSGYCELK